MSVAVPTYRRVAELAELLPLINDQLSRLAATGIEGELLVIDNDPGQSARPLVSEVAPGSYRSEPTPGVVAVRNRALAEADGRDLLIFLDDDQTPSAGWLAGLVGLWLAAPADARPGAVAGPVTSVLPEGVDRWIGEGGFFDRRYRARLRTGEVIAEVATTNLLLDLRKIRVLGLSFDPFLGLSGGEDSLFTRTLSASGAEIWWCAEAGVLEHVPGGRLTRGWVCRRALSSGNTAARVDLMLTASGPGRTTLRARLLLRGLSRTGGGALAGLVGQATRSPGRQGRAARTSFRGLGLLLGALDLSYLEYRRTGRRIVHTPVQPTDRSRTASR